MNNKNSFLARVPERAGARPAGLNIVIGAITLGLLAGCGGGGSSGGGVSNSGGGVPPVVTAAPVAAMVAAGQAATFSVVASGSSLTYQWQRDGTDIAGATSASYTTPATTTQMSGQTFDVVVRNAAGQQVTSTPVALTVTAAAPVACAAVPAAPGGLVSSAATSSSLAIGWAAVTAPAHCSITGYNVYISMTSGFAPSSANLLIAGLASPAYTSSNLAAATTYYYLVEALDAQGASAASAQLTATTAAAAGSGGSGGSLPTITAAPTSQTAAIGTTATFSVTASGTGPFSYQWRRNGVAIAGATSASYNTPSLSAPDDGAKFSVVVSNASGPVPSTDAVLSVNTFPPYTVYPGFIGVDLNNNTHGAWADSQVYVEVIGLDPVSGARAWVSADGAVHASSLADNTAANAIKGPDGHTYPNYAFTLAQSRLLKLPPLNSGRIFISLGAPLYMPIQAGAPLGYGGPNPLNASDPNSSTHYDWYEFAWGNKPGDSIFINTTQVDMFGLPMTLDVWGNSKAFHQQTGITESIAQIDAEFAAETPAIFQMPSIDSPPIPALSPLRIWAPAHASFTKDGPNGHYMDAYIDAIWKQYASAPLTLLLNNDSNKYTGTTSATNIVFSEVDLHNGAYAGPQTYTVARPTTQDLLLCAGSMAFAADTLTGQEVSVTKALEAQICAAFNRHVMDNYANWTIVDDYYRTAPANYFAKFWHDHSIAHLAYGFAFDDVDDQSSSIIGIKPEHMAFGIGY